MLQTPAERARAAAAAASVRELIAAARAPLAAGVEVPAELWRALELELGTLTLTLPREPWPAG